MKNFSQMIGSLFIAFVLLVGTVHAVPIVWPFEADDKTDWFEMNLTRLFTPANISQDYRQSHQRIFADFRHDWNIFNHRDFQFDTERTWHPFRLPIGIWEGRPNWVMNMPLAGYPRFHQPLPHGNNAPAPVPEPATVMLLGIGLVGVAGLGRRRKKL